ncbi:hypothetical protein L1987_14984 [Smallanthus sonchifolius]|uniref:Uncharacterized protein n=1 Tax=Smallanthus sonchifolius TaxID=185202 RepID=A0ACB9J6H1_9ASTR|nr:hypothetical protein L1987_14984 [Smallanthus sonchifolius]
MSAFLGTDAALEQLLKVDLFCVCQFSGEFNISTLCSRHIDGGMSSKVNCCFESVFWKAFLIGAVVREAASSTSESSFLSMDSVSTSERGSVSRSEWNDSSSEWEMMIGVNVGKVVSLRGRVGFIISSGSFSGLSDEAIIRTSSLFCMLPFAPGCVRVVEDLCDPFFFFGMSSLYSTLSAFDSCKHQRGSVLYLLGLALVASCATWRKLLYDLA